MWWPASVTPGLGWGLVKGSGNGSRWILAAGSVRDCLKIEGGKQPSAHLCMHKAIGSVPALTWAWQHTPAILALR